jgi:outer membrane receptor for ferrienterochelin and colicins
MNTCFRTRLFRFIVAVTAATMLPVAAAAQTAPQLADLDLEELLRINIQRVFGASERLQPVTEAPSSVTINTAEEINRYGYRTLAEILGSVRGFFVTNDRNYSYLGARGFGRPGDYNARVLLLVNGHKINDNVFDQAYIGAELGIDVAMFERVEVIRGPASSLYGTSAFFAVVNVVTRSGASIGGASLDADAGTLGSQLGRGSFGRQYANGADVAASATFERSSGVGNLYFPAFDTPGTNRGIAENLDGEQVGEIYARFKRRDFSVTGTYGRRQKLVPTASFSTLFNSQSPREQTVDEHTMIDAQYDRTVGRTRVSADLFFDRSRYDAVYPYAAEHDDMPVLINNDGFIGARWGGGMHATRALPGRQTLTAGGEFVANITQEQWTAYNDPRVAGFDIDQSSRQGAIFVQDELRLRPWLLLNGGVRYDRYQRFARTTPRGAVIVMPSSNQSFKYLYGRAFRAPNMYELYYYDDATSYLRPESIATHEVVWEQYVGEWLRTSLSAYKYTASQLITISVVDPNDPFGFAFFNDGTLRAKGLEAEAEVRSKRGLQLLGSYSLQRAEDESSAPLTNSPREMAKLRLSAPLRFGHAIGAFEVQYLAPRRTLAGTTVPSATIANATITKRFNRTFELVGSVRNLFDSQYADPASDEHASDAIQQNGRTARVGIRWNLWTPR